MPPGAFLVFFCRGHLPRTSARSKQYLPVMCVRLVFIRQNFHAVRAERTTAGLMPPGAFLVFFCRGHLPRTSARSKQYLPVMCVRLVFIRQNFHESWCRKLLAI